MWIGYLKQNFPQRLLSHKFLVIGIAYPWESFDFDLDLCQQAGVTHPWYMRSLVLDLAPYCWILRQNRYKEKSENLESMVSVHCSTLLGHVAIKYDEYSDFAPQMKTHNHKWKLPSIHRFALIYMKFSVFFIALLSSYHMLPTEMYHPIE